MTTPAPQPSTAFDAALGLREATVRAGDRVLLDGVTLSAAPGERVALIGPSGAGKTTLLRLLAGSVWPDAGSVTVLGEDPSRLGGRALRHHRRRVGFLRQQDNLVPPLRVAHNVLMGRLGRWSPLRALWNLIWPGELDLARTALARVELEDRLWALPDELSGGEQQRVAIARLVVQQPDVLLADEPVSALDVRLGAQVLQLLHTLADEREAAMLVSLHNLDLLDHGFHRVVALRNGRVCWQGSPADLDDATLRKVYGAGYAQLRGEGAAQA